MRIFAIVLAIIFIIPFSLCEAQKTSVEKAYSLYHNGEKEAAVQMMEDHIKNNPDPEAFYFLGYAYYEMKKMDKAAKYFNEAFIKSPFYSPIPKKEE